MFTLLAVSLFISHVFFSFFVFLFSLSIFPLLMFASRYVYLLSLSLVLPLLILFFFLKIHLYLFFFFQKKTSFFICSSLFVKLFLFHLLCCFAPFPVCFCFFNRVLSNKINWLFSLGRKTTCLIPPRTYFLNFCFFFRKVFHRFVFDFFEVPFFKKKKTVLLNFWANSTQKWI